MKRAKLTLNKFYLLPSGNLVRVVGVYDDKIIVHNYHSRSNESMDKDDAEKIMVPLFKISEVASMVGKKASTLRTYEAKGLIPGVKKYTVGDGPTGTMRLYSPADIQDLLQFFAGRRGAGRPSKYNKSKIDKDKVKRILNARYGE